MLPGGNQGAKFPPLPAADRRLPFSSCRGYKAHMLNRDDIARRKRQGQRMCRLWAYEEGQATPRAVGRAGRTRVLCSCWMCGNLRHTAKGAKRLTLQERRASQPDE